VRSFRHGGQRFAHVLIIPVVDGDPGLRSAVLHAERSKAITDLGSLFTGRTEIGEQLTGLFKGSANGCAQGVDRGHGEGSVCGVRSIDAERNGFRAKG
jgi:hypothetical protein